MLSLKWTSRSLLLHFSSPTLAANAERKRPWTLDRSGWSLGQRLNAVFRDVLPYLDGCLDPEPDAGIEQDWLQFGQLTFVEAAEHRECGGGTSFDATLFMCSYSSRKFTSEAIFFILR